MSSLTSCLSLFSDPTDITAFRVTVFQPDQLCIQEQNGKTTFTHGAGEQEGRLQQPGFRVV